MLAAALLMAVDALIVFGSWSGSTLAWRLAFLLWPPPQFWGILSAQHKWSEGIGRMAISLAGVQAIVVFVVDALYVRWAFQ
jgi:hypothetical protein